MTKTIKEMAYEHVVAYLHNDEYEEMQDTYIAGANAVLEVIEECLPKTSAFNSNEVIDIITSKIKQLKEK